MNRLDVTSPEYQRNPHGVLRGLAESCRVACDMHGTAVLLRYGDVDAALRDPRLANDYDVLLTRHGVVSGPLYDWWKLAMLNTNPPVHTRLRSLASRAFTPRAIDSWRATIRRLTAAHFDELDGDRAINFVDEVAESLPLTIICSIIGIPLTDCQQFRRWVADLGLMFTDSLSADDRATAEAAMLALHGYVVALIERTRRRQEPTLVGALVQIEEEGDRLTYDELVALVINLLLGALDTSRSALSTGLLLSWRHPELPIDSAFVDEVLRIEPPIGELRRTATAVIDWHGITTEPGQSVALSVMAANRDRAVYRDADSFEPSRFAAPRSERQHLSFGRGAHLCLGQALARVELEEVLSIIRDRYPALEVLTNDPVWAPFARVRRFDRLEVRLGEVTPGKG